MNKLMDLVAIIFICVISVQCKFKLYSFTVDRTQPNDTSVTWKVVLSLQPEAAVSQPKEVSQTRGAVSQLRGPALGTDGVVAQHEGPVLEPEGVDSQDEGSISQIGGAVSPIEAPVSKKDEPVSQHEEPLAGPVLEPVSQHEEPLAGPVLEPEGNDEEVPQIACDNREGRGCLLPAVNCSENCKNRDCIPGTGNCRLGCIGDLEGPHCKQHPCLDKYKQTFSKNEGLSSSCEHLGQMGETNLDICMVEACKFQANTFDYRNGVCVFRRCISGNLLLTTKSGGWDLYVTHLFTESEPWLSESTISVLISVAIGTALGCLMILFLIIMSIICCRKRKKQDPQARKTAKRGVESPINVGFECDAQDNDGESQNVESQTQAQAQTQTEICCSVPCVDDSCKSVDVEKDRRHEAPPTYDSLGPPTYDYVVQEGNVECTGYKEIADE